MYSQIKLLRFVTTVVMVGVPALATAQTATNDLTKSTSPYMKAVALHEAAVALYVIANPPRLEEAAKLHIQEASFREASDPDGVDALIKAAELYTYAEQFFNARQTMEKAAVRAMAMGDVVRAAQAFSDAAHLADRIGNSHETQRLSRKASLLAQSPLLQDDERNALKTRFRTGSLVMEVVKR